MITRQPKWNSADIKTSITALIAHQQFGTALRTLQISLDGTNTQKQQRALLQILHFVPLKIQYSSNQWMLFSARAHCMAADLEGLQTFLKRIQKHEKIIEPYRAWLALRTNKFEHALKITIQSIPHTQGFEAGLLRRIQALALFELHHDGWREAFAEARTILNGVSLGRCLLEEGVCEDRHGSSITARLIWSQALALLKYDAHYSAQIRHNLGISNLRNLLPEAETHFLEMERLSQRQDAKAFHGRALCGIAASRRALGEFERAAFTYQRAIQAANDSDDHRQAHWGLGHTHRLMGRFSDALSEFEQAIHIPTTNQPAGTSWVFFSIAAIHAQTGNPNAAHAALQHAKPLNNEDAQRAKIVQAELARQTGNIDLALHNLKSIQTNTLLAREERQCFPALFAISDAINKTPIQNALAIPQTTIRIQAWGSMHVTVNNRNIKLKPGGRAAELLALLAYNQNRLSTELILEAMHHNMTYTDQRRKRQALWATANELRQALGWKTSITTNGGVYTLDEQAIWQITPKKLQNLQTVQPKRFLDGIQSQWVLDVNWALQNTP